METNNVILVVIILSIVFGAIGDGLRMKDYSTQHSVSRGILYHMFNALAVIVLFTLLFLPINNITWMEGVGYLISYGMIRFGIFDFILNPIAGKHWLYIGDTAGIDKVLRKMFNTPTKLGILSVLRIISLMGGLAIIQNM